MSTAAPVTARFGRRSQRGVLLGLSAWRVAVLGAGLSVFVVFLVAGGAVGLVVGLVVCGPWAATVFVTVGGRPAADWFPIAGHWEARRLTGQTLWRAKPTQPRPAGTLALPGDAAALRFYEDRETGVCMVHDPHRETLSAVLQVTHPAYVLLAPDEQASRVGAWGRVYAGVAQSGTCASLQVLEATIPDSGRGIAQWYARHGQNGDGWADRQYRQLVESNSVGSSTHRTTITLSLDLRAASRAVRASGGGMPGAAKVLRADMAALEYALRAAELRFEHWMNEAEIAHIVRSAYDPGAGGDVRVDSAGANLSHAGPLAIEEHWGHLRHDSGYSTVLWVSEWPRIDVQSHFLHSLIFTPGVLKTFSLSCRSLGTRDALRQIRQEKTELIADATQKAKIGRIEDLADSQEYEDVLARERALIAGHTDVEFTGWVVVTASERDELDGAVKQVERAATQSGCETRVLYGQQSQGFVNGALPLGRTAL